MLDVDEYVNNATDAEAAADSYDTYIGAGLKFPDLGVNPVWGVVRKRIRNNFGNPVHVLNHNPLINTIKYEVQFLDGFM